MTDKPGGTDPMGGGDPTRTAPQCTARSKTSGNRCKQRPIPGGKVCVYHGGKAPQVKRKANLRLLELIDPAIKILAQEMLQADKSADKQRAANSILDRAGVPRITKEINEVDATDLVIERLRKLRDSQTEHTEE